MDGMGFVLVIFLVGAGFGFTVGTLSDNAAAQCAAQGYTTLAGKVHRCEPVEKGK